MNLADFSLKFYFQLNTDANAVYYLGQVYFRGIVLLAPMIFIFFTYNIRNRYRLINERFR